MVGKTFKKTIAKAISSTATIALCAGCFSGISFAAQPAEASANLLLDYETNVLSLVMESAQDDLIENPWENLIVSNYDPYISIYAEDNAASEVVGKLYPGSYGEIVEKGDQWTKITSGDVTGYVLSKDVAFGEDAEKLAQDIGTKVVKITVDELNIRSGPNFYSEIIASGKKDETYRIVPEGSEYNEDTDEILWINSEAPDTDSAQENIASSDTETETDNKEKEGQNEEQNKIVGPSYEEMIEPISDSDGGQWYRIHLNDIYYGYVYADCISVENELKEAVTPEEEADAQNTADTKQTQEAESSAQVQEQTAQSSQKQTDNSNEQTSVTQTQETQETQPAQTEAPATEAPETEAPETEASSNASSDDAYLLACLVYCEAGNQSYEGQLAVANIVLNRVNSSLFPNSISEVIYQSGQFGPVYNGSLSNTLANGPSSACIQAANDALAGNNNIGNLLFFNNYAPSNASSVLTIGDIVFYTYNY